MLLHTALDSCLYVARLAFLQVMMWMGSEEHKLKISCQHLAFHLNFSQSFWSASHDPH